MVSRERKRQIAAGQAVAVTTASEKTARIQRVLSEDGTKLRLYCLRTNELSWDEDTLWHTCTMLIDLEAVFRSLKSELGLRPIRHCREDRAEGHLVITVLARQAGTVLRRP